MEGTKNLPVDDCLLLDVCVCKVSLYFSLPFLSGLAAVEKTIRPVAEHDWTLQN